MLSVGSAGAGAALGSVDALALVSASFAPVGALVGAATGDGVLLSAKYRTLRREQ